MAEMRFPEPVVGVLIFNTEGKMLLLKSHKWRDKYIIPGGHIELGERIEEAINVLGEAPFHLPRLHS